MHSAPPEHVAFFFLGLFVLFAAARGLGELAARLGQPAILGELLAGVLLGPTLFGAVAPETQGALFPIDGPLALMRDGLLLFAVALFLLVTGMEIDLRQTLRRGRTASAVGFAGIGVPLFVGALAAWLWPEALGFEGGDRVSFALCLGVALAISSLPVIARTLLDLDVFRSDLGMVVMAAAVIDDLLGWTLFGLLLSALSAGAPTLADAALRVGVTLVFTIAMLTAVRFAVHRALPWIEAYTAWPSGVLGFALAVALLAAAVSEWLGIHAVFGAFLAGVALGDSPRLRQQVRRTLDQFVSSLLVPLFFASIALRVDFGAHFDPLLVLLVFALASVGKVLGCGLAARRAGMPASEAWAVGFAMNARGAMGLLLAALALEGGLIAPRLFVALVIMSLATSALSGPAIARLLRRPRPLRVGDHVRPETFVADLRAADPRGAIRALAQVASRVARIPAARIEAAVWERECMMSTGIGHGLAVPHATLPGLPGPVVAVGIAPAGVEFEAPDGLPARLVCMILSPAGDARGVQLQLIADLARRLREVPAATLGRLSYLELVGQLRAGEAAAPLSERPPAPPPPRPSPRAA